MWRLNKKQAITLWIGFSALAILLLFPPPGEGQTEWPVFVYSSHEVMGKRLPSGQLATQYGWERPGLADRVRLPVIVIFVFTASIMGLLATPVSQDYPSDPTYRAGFRDPSIPKGRNHRGR